MKTSNAATKTDHPVSEHTPAPARLTHTTRNGHDHYQVNRPEKDEFAADVLYDGSDLAEARRVLQEDQKSETTQPTPGLPLAVRFFKRTPTGKRGLDAGESICLQQVDLIVAQDLVQLTNGVYDPGKTQAFAERIVRAVNPPVLPLGGTMTDAEITDLALTLERFQVHAKASRFDGSIYGKKMDLALASDLRSALVAWGAPFKPLLEGGAS